MHRFFFEPDAWNVATKKLKQRCGTTFVHKTYVDVRYEVASLVNSKNVQNWHTEKLD